jgi:putative ABC transport system permease protein
MWKVTVTGALDRKLGSALTAQAIVLGVTFVAGTLVLGDSLDRTFDTLIGKVYQRVSFQIRGTAVLDSHDAAALESAAVRRPVPQSIATAVRRLPGVADVHGSVGGYAQFVARDGATGRRSAGPGARRSASRSTRTRGCRRCGSSPVGRRPTPTTW